MSLSGLVSFYAAVNLSILVLFGSLFVFSALQVSPGHLLKISYWGIASMAVLAAAQSALPHRTFFQPPVKVWSASSPKPFASSHLLPTQPVVSVPALPKGSYFQLSSVSIGLQALFALALLFFIAAMSVELRRLHRLRQRSFVIRQQRRLLILASDSVSVSLSFWIPFRSVVVVPTRILSEGSDLGMSLLHEFQHHRQGDTRWIYVLRFLQFFCFANPAVHAWVRKLGEIQELACDEALIGRKALSPQAYAGCLVRAAETALSQNERFACATGLTFCGEGQLLKKRIVNMLKGNRSTSRSWAVVLGSFMALSLGCAAWASQGLVRDRQVTMEQALEMAKNTGTDFPVTINESVLAELNRYLGTPDGREFIQESLVRMEQYRPMIESKIKEYHVPIELMAIPIAESGYQNLLPKPDIARSAGLWQFIQTTAWLFTLNVWPPVDERLDPEKETDAAMRLLLGDKIRFGAWDLSILAFNAGEKVVSKGILKTKSHDAWTLIQNGWEGDHGYLARVMAAVLIFKNPTILEP